MVKKIKMHQFFILSIFLVLVLICVSFFQFYKENFSYVKDYNVIRELCYEKKNPRHEYCRPFKTEESLKKYIISSDPKKIYESYDAITLTNTIVEHTIFSTLQYFSPLIIAIAVIGSLHSMFSSGMFENDILRLDYKKYLKKNYKIILGAAAIMPMALIIVFLTSSIITGFNFNISNVDITLSVYNKWKYDNFILYGFLICILQYFMSLVYANIALYCCKKSKNKIVSIIMSYVMFIVLDIFIYIIVYAIILNKIFGLKELTDYFNIAGYWFFNSTNNIIYPVLLAFLLQLVSFLFVYNCFKKKEQVILDYEKQVS